MRRSIATVSMSGTLRDKLAAISAAGFDAIELFEADFINFNGSARELRALAGDHGLGLDLYQPFRDFEGVPDDALRRNLDRAERKFDLMQALGVPLMLVCSTVSPLASGEPERAAAHLHLLAERAAQRGLRVGYEALAWGRWVQRYGQAWAIVEQADHPNLGLILDSFHTLSLQDDPAGIAAIPGERIFFLQMADAPLLAMDVIQWARHHRNFPGQGQLDVLNFFEQVLRAGYTGTLSLEIFNDLFRETPNRRTAVDAMRSLLDLEARARERLVQAVAAASIARPDAAASRALGRVELFEPPTVPRHAGFAFLEFGVDEASATALGALLRQLGFEDAGQHRSKAVTRYRQGRIVLILNAEPGSDARARFAEQGVCVCAIGLATPDPAQAAGRAAALLSARHRSPRAAGELELPAIKAPGGTVLHFVPTGAVLDADFVTAPLPAMAGATSTSTSTSPGLLAIDHIAMGLATGQLDTWVLFARAVLGLQPGESLELADPFGLVRSRGFANAERTLRLVLNVSVGQRTRTARQVSASGRAGGGVHHIALGCDDLFATMAQLRADGVRFVPISDNYYDDLIARLGLDEPRVRRMQALGILFDRSAEGDYLHACAEPFDERFFFEIVQRGAYDAYGVVNAPARLASQADAQALT